MLGALVTTLSYQGVFPLWFASRAASRSVCPASQPCSGALPFISRFSQSLHHLPTLRSRDLCLEACTFPRPPIIREASKAPTWAVAFPSLLASAFSARTTHAAVTDNSRNLIRWSPRWSIDRKGSLTPGDPSAVSLGNLRVNGNQIMIPLASHALLFDRRCEKSPIFSVPFESMFFLFLLGLDLLRLPQSTGVGRLCQYAGLQMYGPE